MTVKVFHQRLKKDLSEIYDSSEADAIIRTLLMDVLSLSSSVLLSNPDQFIPYDKIEFFDTILFRLKKSEPLQYVLGYSSFCGLKVKVNNKVLIPRPETEELVEWIVNENKLLVPSVLDIGTGSGCIAIALAKKIQHAIVDAIDKSSDALIIARENAKTNNVSVNFKETDILDFPIYETQYDLIVSNPPYVLESEKNHIHESVLNYEPHLALFVPDDDPLYYYKAILSFSKKYLNKNGKIFFEFNPLQSEAMVELLAQSGFQNVIIRKDMSGKERMISASKN